MNRKPVLILTIAFVLGAVVGCDSPPAPPKTADGEVLDTLHVERGDVEELERVTAVETSRANYEYRLQVLRGYYRRMGNLDKYEWTEREMENLRRAKTFTWTGIPEITPPAGESLENADQRMLVEYVVESRNNFLEGVEQLVAFYRSRDPNAYKAARVANMLERFDPIRTYMYFMEAELPEEGEEPDEVIPAAEQLYADGMKLYEQGRILPLIVDYEKERQALLRFLELIREHPTSTRAPLAAYFIGEIYKEYFNENLRAVQWYERAWTWDPNITEPARFQAATIYDIRLANRARAVELYRAAIEHEQFNPTNVIYARRRIEQLTGEEAD